MLPDPADTSREPDIARLRSMLRLGILAAAFFGVLSGAVWLTSGSVPDGQTAIVNGMAVLFLVAASRLTRQGRLIAAVTVTVVTAMAVSMTLATVPPPTPGLALLPLVGATVALQYVSGSRLRQLLGLSWLASLGVVAMTEMWLVTERSDWYAFGLELITSAVLLGIAGALILQFGDRLRESLARAKSATAELIESEARHRLVVDDMAEVVFRTDANGCWTFLNPAWSKLTGRSLDESLGTPVIASVATEDAPLIDSFVTQVLSGERRAIDETYRLAVGPDEGSRWLELRARPTVDAEGKVVGLAGTLTEVTERRRLEEQLTELAFSDPLTGLANRALFRDRVEHALALSRRTRRFSAVLFLDLDGFKAVNDSMGHAAGDRLLVAIASRFKECLRPSDTIARLGGDEFGVLLEGLRDESEALDVAGRLARASQEPVTVFGREIVGSASTGIAMLDRRTKTVDEVLRNADVAMYEAKGRREGGVSIFEPAMGLAAVNRMEDLSQLRKAVERGEFFLEYQPIVELSTGRIEGVEALVRWRHPDRGVVPPDDFIPLAEESGLIVPLGAWVIREACQQALAWQRQNPGRPALSISVNVSAVQLMHRDLVTHVAGALDDTGIDPTHLVIEITETAVMTDRERAVERIRILKLLGVRIAIDDFGTGYSSLSYIRRLPVDIIKLDRSFISGVESDVSSAAMAEVFVRLGRALNISTVAEGVEGPKEAKLLRDLRCNLAQGFHFGRPSDAGAIQLMLGEAVNKLPPAEEPEAFPRTA